MRLILLCLLCRLIFAYQDKELDQLYASIPDIREPTLEDYQKIETYLREGERPYLDLLRQRACLVDNNTRRRLNNMLNFKLLGPNRELPIFEIHHLSESQTERCILLFCSHNGLYPQKARRVLEELKMCGYVGDVLLRIGGFPNVQNGGLKICHVPYSFKVAFLQEAKSLGYKEVLWIDTCMHPLTNLERIFSKIRARGLYFTFSGTLEENAPGHLLETAKTLNIGFEHYGLIPQLHSSILGFHMDHPQAIQLLDSWFAETEKVYPNVTWFPEELSLSVLAWRLRLQSDCWFGSTVCGENELWWALPARPTLQFYCEDSR